MARVVPLRYDTAFKKAFSQPDIFCQFVKDVLGIEFHTNEVHQGYESSTPDYEADIECDLIAEDPKGAISNYSLKCIMSKNTSSVRVSCTTIFSTPPNK